MKQATLYLMLGYPGAGKTTTAQVLHEITGAVHIWADQERRKKFLIPNYSSAENKDLYDGLNHQASELLSTGQSVIFDTNFNFFRDREKLRKVAEKNNANCLVIWVTTSKEIARERATQNAHQQDTRVLGNMPLTEFERMSNNLEIPRASEPHVSVDGTKVSVAYVKDLLKNIK